MYQEIISQYQPTRDNLINTVPEACAKHPQHDPRCIHRNNKKV